ncbi:DUF3310 domain-containing protein [Brochothrix thermosphacta]|uniref:DUF3310 domain-containing protein n=1 Tax=Brochothrix thermosphacta TaxID=2756 RepID=UPI00265C98C2|nr:DUF3310 domain-containing protein [Brochothrix thermosphacta]WKK68307.1 DUF3310 domain-containing protein [Brochothrix thermosphacta]
MIYECKEYKEVTDGSAKIGDLLYIYSIDGNRRRDWCLTLNSDPYYPFAEIELPSYINFLDISRDEWTRYRYVKGVEETPVPKEQIIPLTNPKKAHDLINQTSKTIKQTDTVNSPSHYNQTKIEAIDIIEDVTAGYQSNVKYHIGNAIKYLIRAPFKNNTVEDLKKAAWYVNRAIEKLEGEQNKH